jgi:hypothetical protein
MRRASTPEWRSAHRLDHGQRLITQLDEVTTHNAAATQFVDAAGVEFAYRRFGRSADPPLLMLQHFRGNLDN